MKYYYTDPLAAAWMAKHFGMKLYQEAHVHMVNYKSGEKFISPRQFPLDTWETIDIKLNGIRLYIHPDSLHLLEPQEGDEGADESGNQLFYNGMWKAIEGGLILGMAMTDKRNGKPFMWPESES